MIISDFSLYFLYYDYFLYIFYMIIDEIKPFIKKIEIYIEHSIHYY